MMGTSIIRYKLYLIVIVPLLSLTFYSFNIFIEKKAVLVEMKKLEELSHLALQISGFVHEMQKERGISSLFLAYETENFSIKLAEQRLLTDEKISDLARFFDHFKKKKWGGNFQEKLQYATTSLKNLNAKRNAINLRTLSLEDSINYFTAINYNFLEIIQSMSYFSTISKTGNMFLAYYYLQDMKEHSGIVRAILSAVFPADTFEHGLYVKYIESVHKVELSKEQFLDFVSPKSKAAFLRESNKEVAKEVDRIQKIATKKGIKGGFEVDSKYWFEVKTKEINSLGRIVLLLSGEILEVADTKYKEARYGLVVSISLSSVAILFILVVMRDLVRNTEKRQEAEDDLREGDERWRKLSEAAFEGIVTTEKGKVIESNHTFATMFGYSHDEVIRMSVVDFTAPEDREMVAQKIMKEYEGIYEISGLKKDGSKIPIEAHGVAVPYHGGKARITAVRNITERKKYEEELRLQSNELKNTLIISEELRVDADKLREEAERLVELAESATRAKSEFLASMSHEIRTPMNAVMGMGELLRETKLTDEQREYIEMLNSSSENLLRIINDVLDLSKIEAGYLELEQIRFNLNKVVKETCTLMGIRAKSKNLLLAKHVVADVPQHVLGDPVRLRQVLTNLLSNAIKFTEKGEIELRVENYAQPDDKQSIIRFSVRDTGICVSDSNKEKIFDSFSQADSSTTRKYGGTGLGLSICALLVEKMGGRIWVEDNVGSGSVFYFTAKFGLGEEEEEIEREVKGTCPYGGVAIDDLDGLERCANCSLRDNCVGKNVFIKSDALSILLVEDDPVNQKVAIHMLKKENHNISIANNGKEAVDMVTKYGFDLILMDINMPVMSGYEASILIRKLEKDTGKHTPIIAMTALAFKEDKEKCLEAGMNGYISKPISMQSLYATIGKSLQKINPSPLGTEVSTERKGKVFNKQKALERIEDDEQLLKQIIESHLVYSSELMAKMDNAINSTDSKVLEFTAHSIKGSLGTIGAEVASDIALKLELIGRTGNLDKANEEYELLNKEIKRLHKELSVFIAK